VSTDDSTLTSVIIRLVDQGERNRIVTLLTAERGRIATIARGARGKSRRFGGHLDLFHQGKAVVSRRGRSGLATLQKFDVQQPFEGIRQDIVKFAVASFLIELVAHTTVDESSDKSQYALVAQMLGELAQKPSAFARHVLLKFQLRWFYLLGLLPELTDEGLVNAQLTHISSDSIAVAQAYFEGRLDDCEEDEHTADVGRLTRELRRRVLSRPLASESFLRQVLRTVG
jgi:DNA repair protein RecO